MGRFAETAIIVYGLSFGYQEKKLPFSVSVCSKRMEVHRFHFRLQQKNGSCRFPFAKFRKHGEIETEGNVNMEKWRETWTWRYVWTWRHGRHGHKDMDVETWTWRHGKIKQKTEAQAIFLNPFTVCSSCKRKLPICPLVAEVKNGSNPFAKGLWKNPKLTLKRRRKHRRQIVDRLGVKETFEL
jgi:hypothetical protein